MSNVGAAPRATVSMSNARAEASRRNGAKSRGPKTPDGKARSAQNALKHGMRAQKYVVLPDEDAVEFAALQTALFAELAPEGPLQLVLARRVAIAAWGLARADRMEVELFEQRRWNDGGVGIALIRDGNGTRSFETLLRYRGAAIAEFMRALRTLKALQAEQAAGAQVLAMPAKQPRAPARLASRPAGTAILEPKEPERLPRPRLKYALPDSPAPGRTLHEPAAPWLPNEPDQRPTEPSHARTDAAAPTSSRRPAGSSRSTEAGCAMPASHRPPQSVF
jgi:hypothetical protein